MGESEKRGMGSVSPVLAIQITLLPDDRYKPGIRYCLIKSNKGRGLTEFFGCLKSSADDDRIVNIERRR